MTSEIGPMSEPEELGNRGVRFSRTPRDGAHPNKPKAAFTTPYGQFEFHAIPFGLCGAPSTFQHMMYSVFAHPTVLSDGTTLSFAETRLGHTARGPRLLSRCGKLRFPHLVFSIDVNVCHGHVICVHGHRTCLSAHRDTYIRDTSHTVSESAVKKVAQQLHSAHREWKPATV